MNNNYSASSTKVIIKYIPIHESEKVLILEPSNISWVLTLAERYLRSDFLVYQSDIGKQNSFLRQIQEGSGLKNVNTVANDFMEQLQTKDKLIDVVIYQPEKFSAHNLIKSRLLLGKSVLKLNGRLYLITHMRTGAPTHKTIVGNVFEEIAEFVGKGGGGYRIIETINNSVEQTNIDTNIRRKVRFQVLGLDLNLETETSLFSKDDLDVGTRILLENIDISKFKRMLDLGCGWGAIGIVAALMNRDGLVVLTDVDLRAVTVANDNINELKLQDRIKAIATDNIRDIDGLFDLILSNPPFHADTGILMDLFSAAHEKLQRNGLIYIVVEQTYLIKFRTLLEQTFGNVRIHLEDTDNHFFILLSTKTPKYGAEQNIARKV